jgi:hypothetical protein
MAQFLQADRFLPELLFLYQKAETKRAGLLANVGVTGGKELA